MSKMGKKYTYWVFLGMAIIGFIAWAMDRLMVAQEHTLLMSSLYGSYVDIVFKYWAVVAAGVAISGLATRVGGMIGIKIKSPPSVPNSLKNMRKKGKMWTMLVFIVVVVIGLFCLIWDKITGTGLGGAYMMDSFSSLSNELWEYWVIAASGVGITGIVTKFQNGHGEEPNLASNPQQQTSQLSDRPQISPPSVDSDENPPPTTL